MYQLNNNKRTVTFTGRDRIAVKRRALDYWYRHGRPRGRSLQDFLRRCRLSADGTVIIFHLWT